MTRIWLAESSAVQVSVTVGHAKSNNGIKSNTMQSKWHIAILDYDWLKDNEKFCKQMVSGNTIQVALKNFDLWQKWQLDITQ